MNKGLTLCALAASASLAGAQDVRVTEFYSGVTGEDGTNDWFEIQNIGTDILDTGTLFWDDDTPNLDDGAFLDSFLLEPGEIAIFLIADSLTDIGDDDNPGATVIEQFTNVWGSVANVGITNGGGNLSQNGDSINFLDPNDGSVLVSLPFAGSDTANTATTDAVNGLALSQIGVNGAYESNPFFNDNVGDDNNQLTLVGSPGVVPTPGTLALLGFAGLAGARRRR